MAVAPLTPIVIPEAGIAAVTGATTGNTSGGHSFQNAPGAFVVVTNTNGSSTAHSLTFVTPGVVGGNPIDDRVVSVAAGATMFIKVGPVEVYGSTVTVIPAHAELHLSVVYP
jgi:hypothetical protein